MCYDRNKKKRKTYVKKLTGSENTEIKVRSDNKNTRKEHPREVRLVSIDF